MRGRDTQRSKVYAWERRIFANREMWNATMTLEEMERYLAPIWRSERGRVGLTKVKAPQLVARRGMSAEAWGNPHGQGRIEVGTHCHNKPVLLHEMGHCLTPRDPGHGPRFVGVVIGLYCRHLDFDAGELMALADEMGVKYHVRSIGVVPTHGPAWHIERALIKEKPMTEMDLACWCDLTYLQVRGAALHLIKSGRARWLRKKLVLL